MRTNRYAAALALALLATMLATRAGADEPDGSITTSGQATLKRAPDVMRATVLLRVDGKDAREAIQNLAKRRDEVKKKLVALGAAEASIDLGQPNGSEQLTPQQRQMRMMMAARNRKPAATAPSTVTVSCTVQAEWKLATAAPEEAFVSANELQAKIGAAMKDGASKKAKTPEQLEIEEEMAGSGDESAGAGKPDEPSYVFAHKLTDEELAKLSADAIGNARADAQRLATAGGIAVGKVLRISSASAPTEEANPYAAYVQAMTGGDSKPAVDPSEAVGSDAGQVTFAKSLTVTFAAK